MHIRRPKHDISSYVCRFFVIGNAIAGGYLLLSIPFSFVSIVRPHVVGLRLLLITFDTVSEAFALLKLSPGFAPGNSQRAKALSLPAPRSMQVMVALTTAAASSAAAIVYLAHTGNDKANWVAICLQFNDFCQRSSGAVVASFVAAVLLMLLVVVSALAVRKH